MKSIIYYLEQLWVWIVYALMLFPLLPRGIESVLMIGFFIISIFIWYKKRQISLPYKGRKNIFFVLLLSTIFFVYTISLIYSANLEEGINRIIKVLPTVLFPFVFLLLCRGTTSLLKKERLYNIYLFALTIGLFFLHIYFFNELYILKSSHWEIRKGIESLTDIHGTYMSIWIGIGVFLLISKIGINLKPNTLKVKIPQIIMLGYFIYWQVVIAARVPVILTIILVLLFILIQNKNNKSIIIIFSLITIAVLTLIVTSKSNLINRVKIAFTFEQSFPKGDYSKEYRNITPGDVRKGIYFCSYNLSKKSFWYGYGIGDVQDELNVCYDHQFNTNTYQMFKFNSHNQYLQVLLSSGIFALLLFLISLIIPVYLAFEKSNYLLLLFTLFMMFCFLTENVIERHDGVILYSLFNSILIFNSLNKNEKSPNP